MADSDSFLDSVESAPSIVRRRDIPSGNKANKTNKESRAIVDSMAKAADSLETLSNSIAENGRKRSASLAKAADSFAEHGIFGRRGSASVAKATDSYAEHGIFGRKSFAEHGIFGRKVCTFNLLAAIVVLLAIRTVNDIILSWYR